MSSLDDLTRAELAALALAQTSDNLIVADLDGIIRYINHTAGQLRMEDVIGSPAVAFVPPEYRAVVEQMTRDVIETGELRRYETAFVDGLGTTSIYEARLAPARDASGTLVGVVIGSSDITARVDERVDLERLFSLSDDWMAIVDDRGHLVRYNTAFSKAFSWKSALAEARLDQLLHPDEQAATRALIEGAKTYGVQRATLRMHDSDEAQVDTHVYRSPATGRAFVVMRDMSRRHSLERQLLQAQKMEVVGQLAGGVAHDFNNLLMSVLGNAEFALTLLDEDHPAARHLKSVIHAANTSADLTRQLLALSRNRASRPRPVDVNQAVQRTFDMLRRTVPRSIDIELQLEEDLPPVLLDSTQLEQVLLNIAVNARDAMPHGGKLTLSTYKLDIADDDLQQAPWAEPGAFVCIRVDDSGTGIPESLRGKVLQPFFTTKAVGVGTGLGLTIALEILQAHRGTITLGDSDSGGASVRVCFPVTERPVVVDEPEAEGEAPGGDERILLVDDEVMVRELVEQVLTAAGYDVVTARDGLEALARFDEHQFDLLLMDMVMPRMGGGEVARLLRARGDAPTILLMSGYTEDTLDSGSLMGVPLLPKPVSRDVLLRMVRYCLDHG